MDIFAHALWTNALYYKKYRFNIKDRLWAVFFGVLPDLISFSPVFALFFLYKITNIAFVGHLRDWVLNNYTHQSYNYTHSLVIFFVFFVISLAINKGKIWWPILGWTLHILIDLFTHTLSFYPTPFLYPLSNVKNHYAISWAEPAFMMINYATLFLVYILIFVLWKKKNGQNQN